MPTPASMHRSQQPASRHRSHQTIYRHRERRPPSSRPQLTSRLQRPVPRRDLRHSKHQWSLGIRSQTTPMPDGRPISTQLKRPGVNLFQPGRARLQTENGTSGGSITEANKTAKQATRPLRTPLTYHRRVLKSRRTLSHIGRTSLNQAAQLHHGWPNYELASSSRRAPLTYHRTLFIYIFTYQPAVRPRNFTGLNRPPEMNINALGPTTDQI